MDEKEAYRLGQTSGLMENPFWKDYPKESHEADLARWFVEGWLDTHSKGWQVVCSNPPD